MFLHRIETENGRITIKRPKIDWVDTVMSVLFVAFGVMLIAYCLLTVIVAVATDVEVEYEAILCILVFLLIWTFFMCLIAKEVWRISYRTVFDAQGISAKPLNPFAKPIIYRWSEVADWGLFCSLWSRGGRPYTLYFSDHPMETNAKGTRKKLCGRYVRLELFERDYVRFAEKILPYCEAHCETAPFMPVK